MRLVHLGAEGQAKLKLGDFGLSAVCEDEYTLTDHCGTPLYMAPARHDA